MAHVPLPLQGDETQIHVDKIKLLFTDPGMFPLILDFIIWFKIFDFYNLTIFLIYRFNFIIVKQSLDNFFLSIILDSLCYEIETEDVYEDMKSMLDLLDTLNFPRAHTLFSDKNKKVPGKFKDELGGK